MRISPLFTGVFSSFLFSAGCATVEVDDDLSDSSDADGAGGDETVISGGTTGSGGWMTGSGGRTSGGSDNNSGGTRSGGAGNSGGAAPSGGQANTGGFGFPGSGGAGSGNSGGAGNGGGPGSGGGQSTGGEPGAGGGGSVELDCDAQMPTSGAENHSGTSTRGGTGNTAWEIWTNGGPGSLTTYGTTPAFTASWNNSGDYLGRMGLEWGNNSGKAYTEYGVIKADYVWSRTGTAGQYSYLGVYGWSNNPCVEWYIVEDSFHQMPFNTGSPTVDTVEIDGGMYNLVYRSTQGTGGNRCGNVGTWDQFYSIRLEGKQCGTITISDHFDVWAARGWDLGNLLEVKIVVEAAAGQGSVEFPVANVTTSQ